MQFLIILATIFLILDCLLLTLLILIQLPKKEAGVGVAFGGGATDALFGAGSGTALSNLTKYTSIAFFVLVFALGVLNNHARHAGASDLKQQMEKQAAFPSLPPATPSASATAPAASSNAAIPLSITTNMTVTTPGTNAAVPAK